MSTPSLQELQEAAKKAERKHEELKARETVAQEEFDKVKKEIKEAGFKNVAELKAAIEKDEKDLTKATEELFELLGDFMEAA